MERSCEVYAAVRGNQTGNFVAPKQTKDRQWHQRIGGAFVNVMVEERNRMAAREE